MPEGGLEHSSEGSVPRVVKSPAACSSAAKTGEISPASVPEHGLTPHSGEKSLNQGFHAATLPGDSRPMSSTTAPGRPDLSDRVIPEPPQPGGHQARGGDLAFLRAMTDAGSSGQLMLP